MNSFFRAFFSSKKYWAASVVGLMAAFTLSIIVGSYVIGELTYDRWLSNSERIYRLQMTLKPPGSDIIKIAGAAEPLRGAVSNQLSNLVQSATYFKVLPGTVNVDGADYSEDVYVSDSNFFDVFGVEISNGAPEGALSHPNSVAISASNAQRFFGAEAALGKSVRVNGYYDLSVSAVYSDFPHNSHFRPGLIRLEDGSSEGGYSLSDWTSISGYVYVKVLPGVSSQDLSLALPSVIRESIPARGLPGGATDPTDLFGVTVMPLHDIHLHSRSNGELTDPANTVMLMGLSLVSLAVLGLAAFNFATITLTLTLRRARELTIRRYLGESRGGILVRLFTEISVMVIIALLPAALIAGSLAPLIESRLAINSYFIGFGSPHYYALVLSVGLMVVILCWLLTGSQFLRALGTADREGVVGKGRTQLVIQQVLMGLNFVVVIVVVYFAFAVKAQYEHMQENAKSFKKEGIAVFQGIDLVQGFVLGEMITYKVVAEQNPYTLETTLVSVVPGTPITAQSSLSTMIDGVEGNTLAQIVKGDHNLAKMIGLRLVAGRYFDDDVRGDLYSPDSSRNPAGRVILNETAVRALGYASPADAIHETVELTDDGAHNLEVIGVVGDFYWNSLNEPIRPMALLFTPLGAGNMLLSTSAPDLHQYLDAVSDEIAQDQQSWAEIRSGIAKTTLEEVWGNQNSSVRSLRSLMGIAIWFAVLISGIGIITVAVYGSQFLARSMAIRWILGEPLLWSFRAIAIPYIVVAILSCAIGLLGAGVLAGLWLSTFAEQASPSLFVVFSIGVGALILSLLSAVISLVGSRSGGPSRMLRIE